jgi:hypothetical protein
MIFEVIGFSCKGNGHNSISNCLHVYGNCLAYPPGTINEIFLSLTDNANSYNTFDEEENFYLNPQCSSFRSRNEISPIVHDKQKYYAIGIHLEDDSKVNAFAFLRLLDTLFHDKLFAIEAKVNEILLIYQND